MPDDTELDAIAAEVRSIPVLSDAELASLLGEARTAPGGPATARLVEQTLSAVLAGVLARSSRVGGAVDLMDLYQEASVAATVGVAEYAARAGTPAGLRGYVGRLVDTALDEVLDREVGARAADAQLVARVEVLQAAQVVLRRDLGRNPTTLELAGALEWEPREVELLAGVLAEAAGQYDAEILHYLDDAAVDDVSPN